MDQRAETLTKKVQNLEKQDEEIDSAFTYVNRVNKQKRKNRKGRQHHGAIESIKEVDAKEQAENVLRRKIEHVQKRKDEIQNDLTFQQWLESNFPSSKNDQIKGHPQEEAKSKTNLSVTCTSALALGLGSVKDARPAQVQLAFFILMCERLEIKNVQAFDPICEQEDFSILESFNIVPLNENKQGQHILQEPTFVFMPHCTSSLYENFLKANWTSNGLPRMMLCCNNLDRYVNVRSSQQQHKKRRDKGEQKDFKGIRPAQSYIDRSIDFLIIKEVPNLNSGQLNNALNDLAFQTFVPISSFISHSLDQHRSSKCSLPDESDSFWNLIEDSTSAALSDPELI